MDIKKLSRQQLNRLAKSASNYAAILTGSNSNYPGTEIDERLKGMNSKELLELAEKAKERADFLKGVEPPFELALLHGVKDQGYNTQSNGWISSFRGETGIITLETGLQWKAVGHTSDGDAWCAYDGFIEWFPVNF